jgi:transmembrane sensor
MDDARTPAEQAAHWFMRLQENTASPQTFIEWQEWLNAAPDNRSAYENIENTLLRIGSVATMPALPTAQQIADDQYDGSQPIAQWRTDRVRVQAKSSRWRWGRYAAIAAGVALALVFSDGWIGYRSSPLGSYSYVTAPGARQVVDLADGSRVTLDADSALEVHLQAAARRLTLQRGEAYFEVAKDSQRPFIVTAGLAQVTAVGTAFNVRMSDDRTVVAVTEGKVEFVAIPATAPVADEMIASSISASRATLAAQVAAGEAVAYVYDGNLQSLPPHETSLATAWLDGRRQYRNEPLRYVLADVDRYTGRRIELVSDAVGELRFTGTLNLKNSTAWLRGLSVALPVAIEERPDGVLAVSAAERNRAQ